MSGEREAAGSAVVAGTILFPPMLGLDRSGAVPRARLANTIRTADGDFTIVFVGDRAEAAERLLRDGTREVEAAGVWDADGATFRVDRFDVLGADQSHPYRLDQPPRGEAPRDVDLSSLYATNEPTGSGRAGPEPTWPHGPPPPPSEEFAETERPRSRPARQAAAAPDDRVEAGAGAAQPSGGFAPGQRVVARDRGNVGTVVSVDGEQGEVRVRFVSGTGTSAVVAFPPDALEPHVGSRPPQPPPPLRGQAGNGDHSRPGQRRPEPAAEDHWGPGPGGSAPGPASQPSRPGRVRSVTGAPNRGAEGAGQRPAGRSPRAAAAAPRDREGGEPVVPWVMRPLRVHTRRPEPTGEILL